MRYLEKFNQLAEQCINDIKALVKDDEIDVGGEGIFATALYTDDNNEVYISRVRVKDDMLEVYSPTEGWQLESNYVKNKWLFWLHDIIAKRIEDSLTDISQTMKQFQDLKSKHPEAILLFRIGDFYEAYQQDAEQASKILGITLTKSSKQKGTDDKAVKIAGFPYHALDIYLPKLIRAGQRVAICEQWETPKRTPKRCISPHITSIKA